MMREEEYIRSKVGNRTPFRVPEGYFDDFMSQMAGKLPCREAQVVPMCRSRLHRLRPLLYAAACVCIAVFCLTAYFAHDSHRENGLQGDDMVAAHYQKPAYYTYEDELIDYAMMDNTDIYACLASEQ